MFLLHPCAACGADSVADIFQPVGTVRVGIDRKEDSHFFCFSCPDGVEVEAVRVGVDFDDLVMFLRSFDDTGWPLP